MRRILFLAYHFPPVGGGGVQRNSKFVRYLRDFGYEPVVVTGPGGAAGRWTPDDPTLGGDVPDGVEVHRVTGPEPAGAGDVALVSPSLEPYRSTALAAAALAEALDRPWVADLQDPWALDEMRIYPSDLHRRRELRWMRAALESADAIVMNTPEAAQRVRGRF